MAAGEGARGRPAQRNRSREATDSAKKPEGGPVDYAVFCGVDVGKSTHHACALDPAGRRLRDKALPNDETALRQVFTDLGVHGRVLVVVDQPASIGALAIAVAPAMGVDVAYLPGLAMRRIADLHPGQSKTYARDAFVIAYAARSMPHTLRRVSGDEETVTELRVLGGYHADLVESGVRLSNQLRDSLLHVHPALERVLGPRLDRPGALDLLAAAPTPHAMRELGVDGIAGLLRPRSPHMARTLPGPIITARHADGGDPGDRGVRPGHRRCRSTAARRPVRTRGAGSGAGAAPGGPPSCRGPEVDARGRAQDRPDRADRRR